MAAEWFYFKGEQRIGPVASSQLKELAANGSLVSTDPIWKEGMANPQPASKLKGLFEAPAKPLAEAASSAVVQSQPVASPDVNLPHTKTESVPAKVWGGYKKYVAMIWQLTWGVVTATWHAARCLVVDLKNRRETSRLKSLLTEKHLGFGEKLFAAGLGPSELRQQIAQKNQAILNGSTKALVGERQALLRELAAGGLTVPQNESSLQESEQSVHQAQGALTKHDQDFATLVATRTPVDKRRAWIGAGVIGLGFFAVAIPKDQQSVTEDYIPHKVGAEANYRITIPDVGIAEHQWSFEPNGQIDTTMKKLGGKALSSSTSHDTRVVRDGFVGVIGGGESGGAFIHCLKIGAKKGDSWEKEGAKYQITEFGTFVSKYDKKSRVTVSVRQEMPPLPNGKTTVMTLVFAKGLGLIRKTGQGPAGEINWELSEPEKDKNPTKAQCAFYDDDPSQRSANATSEQDKAPAKDQSPYDQGYEAGSLEGKEYMRGYKAATEDGKQGHKNAMQGAMNALKEANRLMSDEYNKGKPSADYAKGRMDGFLKATKEAGVR